MHVRSLLAVALALTGCRTTDGRDTEVKSVDDIQTMTAIAPGKFAVVCKYHGPNDTPELRTSQQIMANDVCNAGGGGGGMALACSFENGSFKVIKDGQTFEQTANAFAAHKIACGKFLGALYDGQSLVVFNANTSGFDKTPAEPNVASAKVQVTDSAALFQGAKKLVGYARANGAFASHDMIAVSGFVPVWSLAETSVVIYDGDRIYSFCNGAWTPQNAVNKSTIASVSTAGATRSFLISDYLYKLDTATCSFTRTLPPQRTEPPGTTPACAGSDHNGSWAQGGGCSHNGCWPQGGSCDHNGCWRNGGGCDHNGCWTPGGGCSHNGCWEPGGGCDHNGCWRAGGQPGIQSFPADKRSFVCKDG